MPSRNIARCHWRIQAAFPKACAEWARLYPTEAQPLLDCGVRTGAEQNATFAQGRRPLAEINAMRGPLGMYLLGAAEAARPVTWSQAGQSPHNYEPSFAFDVAFVKDRKTLWTPALFTRFAKLLRAIDPQLTWGGDWNRDGKEDTVKSDKPHFEVYGWRTVLATAKPV